MLKPIAVAAGDIHYDMSTLKIADVATRMAIAHANSLNVPFIANGDTHNTKAHLRGECVKAMIETFKTAIVKPYVNIGNHCRINEKSVEHSLEFLTPYATIINEPAWIDSLSLYIIPYCHNTKELLSYLSTLPKGSTLVMHQGVTGTNAGHYIQDATAIPASALNGFRTILSHYHARQDISCGSTIASYIGNPYSLNFGEANDPEKGYQILYNDGSLEFVPTSLREHYILDYTYETLKGEGLFLGEPQDILWVKIRGTKEQLMSLTKKQVAYDLDIEQDFKLDLIPLDTKSTTEVKATSKAELLDGLIDSLTNTSAERKIRLKTLWKGL